MPLKSCFCLFILCFQILRHSLSATAGPREPPATYRPNSAENKGIQNINYNNTLNIFLLFCFLLSIKEVIYFIISYLLVLIHLRY